jgi:hypothetical protein
MVFEGRVESMSLQVQGKKRVWTSAPSEPAPLPPARQPGSIRRTSSMLMSWPGGLGTELQLDGRARDLFTPPAIGGGSENDPVVVAEAELHAVTGRERDIKTIEATPPTPGLQHLVGCRAGAGLRRTIAEHLAEEVEGGTPLHLLLDDLAGTTLIAGFAYFKWAERYPAILERFNTQPKGRMTDICSGFQDGSSALNPDGTLKGVSENTPPAPPLADPDDPMSWHELGGHPEIAMRRARRIDVWTDADAATIHVDAMFRDTCWIPDGTETVLHEYRILATADAATGILTNADAIPLVLPYVECPEAAPNAARLVGLELRRLRAEVLERLKNADCCTHLNDGLRALAEVPVLAASL